MKNLLIYWVVGCFVVGLPLGWIITDCPKAKMPAGADMVTMIATWPVFLAMAVARTGQPPLPKTSCEALQ